MESNIPPYLPDRALNAVTGAFEVKIYQSASHLVGTVAAKNEKKYYLVN
jgi:hypothetical protein